MAAFDGMVCSPALLQSVCAESVTREQAVRFEILEIYFVEFLPLGYVGEHDRAFENVVERAALGIEDAGDVFHHLACFGFDASGHEFKRAGAMTDLTRKTQHIARPDRIRERQTHALGAV